MQIDAGNPGEVLACCGLAVLAARRNAGAVTGFVEVAGGWRFDAPEPDLRALLGPPETSDGDLVIAGVRLDWWEPWGRNPEMKLWAGNQDAGTITRNLREAARGGENGRWHEVSGLCAGRLGVDPAGTWNAVELGWSINEHRKTEMACRPFVELLAMIGLQEFRLPGRKAMALTYSLWGPAPLPIAQAAFAGYGWHRLAGFRTTTVKNGKFSTMTYAVADARENDGSD